MPALPRLILIALLAAATTAPASAQDFLDRAREAVRDAGKKVEEAAKETGRSVRDFLTENPDLNGDIVDFGKQVGVPGFEAAKPAAGPQVALSVPEARAGADVTLTASGLPGAAEVSVSATAGPLPADTRPLTKGKTNDRGELTVTLAVPPKPDNSDQILFLVETADGSVRVASKPFRIAAPAEAITVTGTLSNEGAECPALRGDDGKLYTLTPRELGPFKPGDRVRVDGTVAQASTCQQGTTVVVEKMRVAK